LAGTAAFPHALDQLQVGTGRAVLVAEGLGPHEHGMSIVPPYPAPGKATNCKTWHYSAKITMERRSEKRDTQANAPLGERGDAAGQESPGRGSHLYYRRRPQRIHTCFAPTVPGSPR